MSGEHLRPARFSLGQLLITPGAMEALAESRQTPELFLARHVRGDWGEVCDEDRRLNDQAVGDGSRILSVYRTQRGVRLWIITEAVDGANQRGATTILLPEEY